jgi:hypothetical protein
LLHQLGYHLHSSFCLPLLQVIKHLPLATLALLISKMS